MSLTSAARRRRPAVLVPVVGVVTGSLLLAGCSFTSRDLTLEDYAPSDGLQADLGDVLVRNVLVVSEGSGAPGVLSGALVNRGDSEAVVLVEVSGTSVEVEVAPSETVFLSAYDDPDTLVVIDSVDVIAGDVVPTTFSVPLVEAETLRVPVLLPEGSYEDVVP